MSDSDRWDEARRRQLFERYGKRADEAANFFRAVLFALATVSGGFLVSKNYNEPFNPHSISIFLFGTAIALIVYSWDYQKTKSILRAKALKSEDWSQNYQTLQSNIERWGKNQTIDRWAAGLIFAGFAVEIVIKITHLYGK